MNTLMGQPVPEALLPLDRRCSRGRRGDLLHRRGLVRRPDDRRLVEHRRGVARGARPLLGRARRADRAHPRARHARRALARARGRRRAGPVGATLPEEAFFHRFGHRVQEHDRYHLDFRHPAARAHLDETVDDLVRDFGISYLKLDYNINPGAGTEWLGDHPPATACSPTGGHSGVARRRPGAARGLLIENCASGAMRADYSLLGAPTCSRRATSRTSGSIRRSPQPPPRRSCRSSAATGPTPPPT